MLNKATQSDLMVGVLKAAVGPFKQKIGSPALWAVPPNFQLERSVITPPSRLLVACHEVARVWPQQQPEGNVL